MDTAKGCNFLLTNGGRMQDYWGVGKATRPMLPFTAIPTTAGHGEAPGEPSPLEQAQAEVDTARAAVVAAEERVKELGDKLNPMSPSFIYGAAQSGDAAGEEIRTRQALQEAEAQLAQARDGLVKANQAYERVRLGQPARPPEDR